MIFSCQLGCKLISGSSIIAMASWLDPVSFKKKPPRKTICFSPELKSSMKHSFPLSVKTTFFWLLKFLIYLYFFSGKISENAFWNRLILLSKTSSPAGNPLFSLTHWDKSASSNAWISISSCVISVAVFWLVTWLVLTSSIFFAVTDCIPLGLKLISTFE